MMQNTTNISDQYTCMRHIPHKCYHGHQSPVFCEGVLELYQEATYMATPSLCTEEPQHKFHNPEQGIDKG